MAKHSARKAKTLLDIKSSYTWSIRKAQRNANYREKSNHENNCKCVIPNHTLVKSVGTGCSSTPQLMVNKSCFHTSSNLFLCDEGTFIPQDKPTADEKETVAKEIKTSKNAANAGSEDKVIKKTKLKQKKVKDVNLSAEKQETVDIIESETSPKTVFKTTQEIKSSIDRKNMDALDKKILKLPQINVNNLAPPIMRDIKHFLESMGSEVTEGYAFMKSACPKMSQFSEGNKELADDSQYNVDAFSKDPQKSYDVSSVTTHPGSSLSEEISLETGNTGITQSQVCSPDGLNSSVRINQDALEVKRLNDKDATLGHLYIDYITGKLIHIYTLLSLNSLHL